jgi:hypothetical protein
MIASLPWNLRRVRMRAIVSLGAVAVFVAHPAPVLANNYGESLAWQFKTTADRANQAAMLDMIERRRGGYYAAPVYNTNIARQYNCSIAASATGNSNGQSAIANSPNVTGATSTATGNDSSTTVGDGGSSGTSVDGHQANSGAVQSGVTGSTQTTVRGSASQALNASQTNSGAQSTNVQGSNACSFAALN